MNVTALQIQLHKAIDTVTDSSKLEAIYTLLENSSGPFSPLTLNEYIGTIDEAREQIAKGQSLNVDEFEKESENW
jgi:hypothetical protein